MKYSIPLAMLVAFLGLGACVTQKPAAEGPPGPQGEQGEPGKTGGTTVIVPSN
jgi:hypothetical protein